MNAIEITGLSKVFGDKQALNDVSLKVPKGEICGFLGPNGAGKTTTIRCLMDFIRPSSGEIKVFGLDSCEQSAAIKADIGYLSSDNQFYNNWTAAQHIRFVEDMRGKSKAKVLVNDLDLVMNVKYRNLSSGNKQKLGVVLALMHQPKLIIMDEPTRGLDPLLQNKIYSLLRDYRDNGGTVFMSSHNLPEVEQVCDHVAIIRDGKLVENASLNKLRALHTHLVNVAFEKPAKREMFKLANVAIEHYSAQTASFKVKGDINPLMQALAQAQIKDVSITHASLEDVFMEFYK